jgi:DNA-binding GntR family transcriptional regulator
VSQPTVVTASVSEQIMSVIRDAIVKGKLAPGELYSVEQVASMLGLSVSRTPVREALVRLVDAGLVSFERNRGVRILQPNVHDLEELFQLRLMVEVPAAFRAAQGIDDFLAYRLEGEIDAMARAVKASQDIEKVSAADESDNKDRNEQLTRIVQDFIEHDTLFHELIISAAGNQKLVRTVRIWRDMITALGGWRLTQARSLEALLTEHQDILETIRNKDCHATARTMYCHIKETGNVLMKELQKELPDSDDFDPRWYEGIAIPSMA